MQDDSIDRNLGKARQAKALMIVINNASIKPIANHLLQKLGSNNS
ncbi:MULTISPECIES: hypothetical protein [unclassified Sphaerospermopsis]|nr:MULTISPECIES: hypothetical protein [unclassified Sphaerospermopsis]